MDRSTRILIDKIGIALSLILGALAVVGEFLGWWDAVGVVLSVFSLILGVVSVVDINGSRILDELSLISGAQRALHADHRSILGNQEDMVSNQASMLENQEQMVDHQRSIGATLDRIEQILDARLPEDS